MTIVFRDRPLKKGEKYHHYCTVCGNEVHPDMVHSHPRRCRGRPKYPRVKPVREWPHDTLDRGTKRGKRTGWF